MSICDANRMRGFSKFMYLPMSYMSNTIEFSVTQFFLSSRDLVSWLVYKVNLLSSVKPRYFTWGYNNRSVIIKWWVNGLEDEVKMRCEQIWFNLLLFSNYWTSSQGHFVKTIKNKNNKAYACCKIATVKLKFRKYLTFWSKTQLSNEVMRVIIFKF